MPLLMRNGGFWHTSAAACCIACDEGRHFWRADKYGQLQRTKAASKQTQLWGHETSQQAGRLLLKLSVCLFLTFSMLLPKVCCCHQEQFSCP